MYFIKSIIINFVQVGYAPTYIANCFKHAGIANILRITMIPCNDHPGYLKVFADIAYWHDTELAYDFIHRLMNNGTVRFRHTRCRTIQKQRWNVHINKNHRITTDDTWKSMTTIFPNLQILQGELCQPLSQEGVIDINANDANETETENDTYENNLQKFADEELHGEYSVVKDYLNKEMELMNQDDMSIPKLRRDDETISCKNGYVLVKNQPNQLNTYINLDFLNENAGEMPKLMRQYSLFESPNSFM